jgi:hypothetical protein
MGYPPYAPVLPILDLGSSLYIAPIPAGSAKLAELETFQAVLVFSWFKGMNELEPEGASI